MTELTLTQKIASSVAITGAYILCMYLYIGEVTNNIIPYLSLWVGVMVLGASITQNKNIFQLGIFMFIPWVVINFFSLMGAGESEEIVNQVFPVLWIYPVFILISGGLSLYEIWTGEDATDLFD